MSQLTAKYLSEKANKELSTYGERLYTEGADLICEIIPGKSVYICIDLHAVENEHGGPSLLYQVYELTSEEKVFDDCYDTAEEALEVFGMLCAKYNGSSKQCEDDNIQDVSYVSVWNGGFKITSSAKWNTVTGEVFDIITEENEYIEENVDAEGDPLEFLDNHYIELYDGNRIEVTEAEGQYYAFVGLIQG